MGRNKKRGERYPSGKLKPTGEPIQPALWQRVRVDVAKLAADSRLSSEVGRLSFHRELTDLQATAAFRIGAIYGSWERVNGLTRRTRSPSYEAGFSGARLSVEAVCTRSPKNDKCRCQICVIRLAYQSINGEHGHLRSYPRTWREQLERLCCSDEWVPTPFLPHIRAILDDIAIEFGISKSKKRGGDRRVPSVHQMAVKRLPTGASTPAPKPPSSDKSAYLTMLKHMRPDLDDEGRERAFEMYQAVKDREKFNREKEKR